MQELFLFLVKLWNCQITLVCDSICAADKSARDGI